MLYGFSAPDVVRLRQLVAAYEQGRIRIDAPRHEAKAEHQNTSLLGSLSSPLAPGASGTALYFNAASYENSSLPGFPVYNNLTYPIPIGEWRFTLEPTRGVYYPDDFLQIAFVTPIYLTATNATLPDGSTLSVYNAYRYMAMLPSGGAAGLGTGANCWLWTNQPLPSKELLGYPQLFVAMYLGVDKNNMEIWGAGLNWPTQYIGGATGADGIGNIFVDGICTNVGGPVGGSSTDYGSEW